MSKEKAIRCYGFRTSSGRWQGVCLDFNLAAEADTIDQLKSKMGDIIKSYIESVLDTPDKSSIIALLNRKAPFKNWVLYYLIKSIIYIKESRTISTFQNTAIVPL
jgi:hypothetical protein